VFVRQTFVQKLVLTHNSANKLMRLRNQTPSFALCLGILSQNHARRLSFDGSKVATICAFCQMPCLHLDKIVVQ